MLGGHSPKPTNAAEPPYRDGNLLAFIRTNNRGVLRLPPAVSYGPNNGPYQ